MHHARGALETSAPFCISRLRRAEANAHAVRSQIAESESATEEVHMDLYQLLERVGDVSVRYRSHGDGPGSYYSNECNEGTTPPS